MPPTGPEFVAAIPGMDDMEGVGASPAPGANDDAVAMLETELLLVGLPGRAGTKELGDAGKPAEGCLAIGGAVAVDAPGILDVVGVGVGVEWFDDCEAVVLIVEGVWWCTRCEASGPVYFSPNSPGENVKAEQKPSEELINSVDPSLDHVTSVKVAKCKLLTIHSGFCCCVSYTWIASCVATAYIMRYGRLKAGAGPAGVPPEVGASVSTGLGDAAAKLGDGDGALVKGGGSMDE